MPGRISNEAGRLAVEGLEKAGINFVSILPDIQHTSIQLPIEQKPDKFIFHHMSEEALGFSTCVGAWLGGKKPALVCTTAGLYNMLWAISAFQNFDFPIVMLVPHRGVIGEKTWFMRKYIFRIEEYLKFFEVPYVIVEKNEDVIPSIKKAADSAFNLYAPTCILFSGGTMW